MQKIISHQFNQSMQTLLRYHCAKAKVTLEYSQEYQRTAILTLNNASKRNTLCLETLHQLQDKLQQLSTNVKQGQSKIMLLKGEGKVFSAGHDLKDIRDTKQPEKIFEQCATVIDLLKDLPIPTICLINGSAVAAGLQLALGCDMILATEKSIFSTPGVKFGLFCSTPGVELTRVINSEKKANEMLLLGESITAKEAYHYGLVNHVATDQEQLNRLTKGFVEKINHLSGQVIALGKAALNEQRNKGRKDAYCVAVGAMRTNIMEKADCREGLQAFAEKRSPSFKK